MPTKWRSYCDHRFCDVTSPYVLSAAAGSVGPVPTPVQGRDPESHGQDYNPQSQGHNHEPAACSNVNAKQWHCVCRPTIVSTIDHCVLGTRYLLCLETLVSNRPSYISTKTRRIPQGQGMQGRSLRGQDLQRQGLTLLCLSPEYKL